MDIITISLIDKSFKYTFVSKTLNIINKDLFVYNQITPLVQYILKRFFSIVINTKATKYSIARYKQYIAYKKWFSEIKLNKSIAKAIKVQFSISSIFFISSFIFNILIKVIKFNIIYINVPLLLCLVDINRLKVIYNNIKNVLITPLKIVLVVCYFKYFFFIQGQFLNLLLMDFFANNPYFLINIKLKYLYYTFKHLLVAKLFNLLNKSSYNITKKAIN